mgnify:CR=1 FL=1
MHQPMPFSEATIEVVSISSSGLPARHPNVEDRQARACLCKIASKVELPGDLIRLGEEVFGCGWPDVTVTYRYPGTSANEVRELTLARQPYREGPAEEADLQDPSLRPCSRQ